MRSSPELICSSYPLQLDLLPPVEQCRRVTLQRSVGRFQSVEVRQQPADRRPHFLTSQVRAQTEVDAVSECQILAGRPVDQEAVGFIEATWIPIGCGHVQRDDGALGDWCS